VLDLRCPRWLDLGDELARVLAAPMPPPAVRIEAGEVTVLRWARDPLDRAELVRAATLHERWLTIVLAAPIDRDWNRHGDREAERPERFVRLAVDDRGQVDPVAWAALDATTTVVVPSRRAALAIAPRAAALGVAVRYADNDGRWWDPFPPGDWIEYVA